MRKVKYYKCPECGKKFKTLGGWGEHVQTMHPGSIPEGFTIARYFYFTLTGKTAGSCIMCKSPTQWNESTGKYDRFCTNPKCKQEYVKIAKKRMRDKYGKEYLLNDPEMQRKMLAAKHISGEYAFSDGSGKLGYVGTYEKDFLMMMDKFMRYSATDIIAPSPHTYYYEYQGTKHFYIPDFYVPNLNLEIEIKAQDNTHPKIQAIDKVKERLKDEMMMANPKINYLKINDKNYNNFFEYLLSLKDQIDDKDVSPSTKNSAEFKAATESAFDYYEDTEVPEYEIDTISEANEMSLQSYFNHKNWEFNLDKWKPAKDSNILYVTGFAGSGKSTFAKDIVEKTPGAVYVDMDMLVLYSKNRKNYGEDTSSSRLIDQFYADNKSVIGDNPEEDDIRDRTTYAMDWINSYARAHASTMFVVEGIWLMYYCAPEYFRGKPIIVIGTSIYKSEKRRAYRDGIFNKEVFSKYKLTSETEIRKKFINSLESATESLIPESKTEDLNPVVVVFSSYVNPLLAKVKTYAPDRFNSFGIVLNDSSDPYGFSLYSIEPSADWLIEGYPISCYFKKQSISEIPQGASMMSIVTYVSSDEYDKIQKRVNNPEIIFTGWSELLETWFSHSDRYRFFCNRLISAALNEEKNFESRDYILLTISTSNAEIPYWEDLRNKLLILSESPMGPARERQAFEESVLEESLYGYLPEEMEAACENAFSGWEDVILEDLDSDDDEYDEANESWVINNKDYTQNLDKWKVGGSNILFITGHSGSGKSTLAEKLERDNNAYMFELDGLDHNYDSSNMGLLKKLKDRNPEFKRAVENGWSSSEKDNLIIANEKVHLLSTVTKDLIALCHDDKQHLFIIEGIQIFQWLNPSYFKDKPLIIMGTSMLQSYLRAGKRDGSFKNINDLSSRFLSEKMLSDFKKRATESAYDDEPAEESLLLKTKFNQVKVKGTLSLTKFTRQDLTQEVLDKYKEKCASFGHCRISKGYLYTDKSDNIVGFVNVVRKQDNIKWIQALNIQPHYQGYGLYEQLMKVAVRELGGTDIETPPKNDTAKLVYQKFGFKTYTNETTVHAMSIRSDAKSEKYDAKAKPNATTIVEAGLHPVYILLLDAKMGFGNVVKFFTNAPYSHALIGFDSSMSKMYSFATRDGHTMVPLGFSEENISTYAKKNSRSKYALYVKLVDTKDYKLMKSKLASFTSNKTDFRYDVGGAVKAFMGKHNANEKRYFCSGFVAYILNSGQSKVTEKDYDLTKPMDLTEVKNIHLVDMGLCKDYNQAYVEKKTKQIFEKHYMHKEKDSHHQPIDEEEELKQDKKENNEG